VFLSHNTRSWFDMNSRLLYLSFLAAALCISPAHAQSPTPDNPQSLTKIPPETILAKGAQPSASDSATPVPEDATISKGVFTNPYFAITYPLPANWIQEYEGPPPSETGRYVLAQIGPPENKKNAIVSLLITAQDLFFSPFSATNAQELAQYTKDHLQADYQVEQPPMQTNIAGRAFTLFAYWSPVAELHWSVLTTEIRCHAVQFILTSRDPKLLQNLIVDMNKMTLPDDASPIGAASEESVPMCIKDYVRDENIIARPDPVFTEHRFNPIPVRIIIDKEGKVKHIHVISAFPDQAEALTGALQQWKFKPYRQNGKPVEVETGILFGPTHTKLSQAQTDRKRKRE
jgi:hypothetical protein